MGDEQGEGYRDDKVITGLEIVVIGKERGVSDSPEKERGHERIEEKTGSRRKTDSAARSASG